MNRTTKIILISVAVSSLLIGTYFIYKKYKPKKKPKSIKQIEDSVKEEIEELIKEKPELKKVNYESSPYYIELKKDLAKVYDIFSNEQFEMCPTVTPQIINCKNKEPFSVDATQGTWILMKTYFTNYKNKFIKNEKDNAIKTYGKILIDKAELEFNRVYQPQFYNTTTNWYAEYLKNGGTPIPS